MTNETKFTVRRYRIADQVYDILKSQILKGVLPPGQEIAIEQIGKTLNTSKTPIREALHRLKGERLVVDTNRGKMIVTKLSPEEIVHISELYAALQTLALKWGFERISREKLRDNLRMLREAKKDLDQGNPQSFLEIDIDLHDLIGASSGNPWLVRITSQVRSLTAIIRNTFTSLERYEEAWQNHVAVVECLLAGDKDGAIESLNLHIEHVKDRLLASLWEGRGEQKTWKGGEKIKIKKTGKVSLSHD